MTFLAKNLQNWAIYRSKFAIQIQRRINLTIWKINNFFLILYGEISVLIGPIPRLFVTGAYKSHKTAFDYTAMEKTA